MRGIGGREPSEGFFCSSMTFGRLYQCPPRFRPSNVMKYEDGPHYHIYNRGAHRQNLFLEDKNYVYCLELMGRYLPRYDVEIQAYCLLPNHYHLVMRQRKGGSISRFLQSTFNSYAQSFNSFYNHAGTIFEGRAKGRLIDSESYAVHLVRYVHLNPVAAGLVKSPADWNFSDYRVWCGLRAAVVSDLTLRDSFFDSAKEYRHFAEASERGPREVLPKALFIEDTL